MSSLPQFKGALRDYVELVDDLVGRSKGKLPCFSQDEVKSLLHRDSGEVLRWTKEANREFRWMEGCTKIYYDDMVSEMMFGMEDWPADGYWWHDNYPPSEDETTTVNLPV